MERRTGLAVAGAVTLVLLAGAIAVGANLGLLGSSSDGPAGKLRPADFGTRVATVEVTDPPSPDARRSDDPAEDGVPERETPDDEPSVHASPSDDDREDADHKESNSTEDDRDGRSEDD